MNQRVVTAGIKVQIRAGTVIGAGSKLQLSLMDRERRLIFYQVVMFCDYSHVLYSKFSSTHLKAMS